MYKTCYPSAKRRILETPHTIYGARDGTTKKEQKMKRINKQRDRADLKFWSEFWTVGGGHKNTAKYRKIEEAQKIVDNWMEAHNMRPDRPDTIWALLNAYPKKNDAKLYKALQMVLFTGSWCNTSEDFSMAGQERVLYTWIMGHRRLEKKLDRHGYIVKIMDMNVIYPKEVYTVYQGKGIAKKSPYKTQKA